MLDLSLHRAGKDLPAPQWQHDLMIACHLQLASEYQSKRHLGWVEKTYNRLRVLPIGKEKRLSVLHDALIEANRQLEM